MTNTSTRQHLARGNARSTRLCGAQDGSVFTLSTLPLSVVTSPDLCPACVSRTSLDVAHETLTALAYAMVNGQPASFTYTDRHGVSSTRSDVRVSKVGQPANGHTAILADTDKGPRTFRIAQITDLSIG